MRKTLELTLTPEQAFDQTNFDQIVMDKLKLKQEYQTRLLKRSVDARFRQVKVRVQAEVFAGEEPPPLISYSKPEHKADNDKRVVIVGAGPAGLFAALQVLEYGLKPIIVERGKDVRARRRDLAAINKHHIVNPDSNYCFGEGGAGTYSDGKLYTRSKKRGDLKRILEVLVAHGAKEDILYEAHPHIGTNKLPKIIEQMRETIITRGGGVLFDTRVEDLVIQNDEIKGVIDQHGNTIEGMAVILATGHSARDIFRLLNTRKVLIEAKPFALGVRIEHPQVLIDKIQYNCSIDRGPYLPASSYALVHQAASQDRQRGVFSFCMCPGGFIVPSATAPGEVVVNGMSPSRRDSKYANSGIVVSVEGEDFKGFEKYGALAAMEFQASVEQKACGLAGNSQVAPAQRMTDFVTNRTGSGLLPTSYQPGLEEMDMRAVLPDFISDSLRQSFKAFGKKMKGYLTEEAQIVGVESRTSSPVRIPRDKATLEHTEVKRLYPCGEGAGYAGGIVSAAMDGERCAKALMQKYAGVELI
ncbi:MAG: FAD-dependent protein [Bacteroidota bacterium]